METNIIKHFVGKNVEVMVRGTWVEGFLQPIANGIVILLPIGTAKQFYGPAHMKMDIIDAIREVKTQLKADPVIGGPPDPVKIKSVFETVDPKTRFSGK